MSYFVDRIHRALREGKVALYIRSATEENETHSGLSRQRQEINRRIPATDDPWVPVYTDMSVSAFAKQKPGLEALCKDVEAGKYKYVLAADITRWSRSVVTVLELKEFALKHDCEFLSLPEIFRAVRS